jgi:hypothetical protein
MIEKLVERLREVDPGLSAEDLADALWLSRLLGPAHPPPGAAHNGHETRSPSKAATGAGTRPVTGTDAGNGSAATGHGEAAPNGAGTVQDGGEAPHPPNGNGAGPNGWERSSSSSQLGIYPPEALRRRESAASPVRSPTLPAVPHALAIARALRPLRLAVRSPLPGRLNEERTVLRFADTLIWDPQLDPVTEPMFDLVLVVDVAPSMVVWQHTADELRVLLERLGAFRDVRIRHLDTDAREPADVVARPGPGERRIVLVVSDCVGAAWQGGGAARLLERWSRTAAVAIVQPLPQRLWSRTGVPMERVWLRAGAAGTPNAGLSVRMRDRAAERPPGVAVPVLEVDRGWLEPWAAMVAGAHREVPGMALFTGRPLAAPPPEDDAENGTEGPPSGLERVLRFRASASPKAVELAGYLAAAPLRLPVMRLVQGTMMPGSTPAHLAEVFLGGLLRVVDDGDGGRDPFGVAYEFHDGVREVLLSGVQRDDMLHVLRQVWDTVRDRIGSSLDFPALLAAVPQDPDVLRPDQPFAQVTAGVLARLGGRYGEVARCLVPLAREDEPRASAGGAADAISRRARDRQAVPYMLGGVPPRNPDFHGRADPLSRVHESMRNTAATVLLSDGGNGKTEIAIQATRARLHEYDLVWWIPAADALSVRASLGELARRLGTPLSDDLSVTVGNLLRMLGNGLPDGGRWLLVYDDAGAPAELASLLPRPRSASVGDVLVTSRDGGWRETADAIEVDVFTRPESVSLLERRVPGLTPSDAEGLAEALGDHPPALVQAAAHLVATGSDVSEYLRLFHSMLPKFQADRCVTATGIALDGLRTRNPVATDLLTVSVFLGQGPPPGLTPGTSGPGERRALHDLHLAGIDPDSNDLLVPRHVRDAVKATLSGEEAARAQARAHRILIAATPEAGPEDRSTWPVRAKIAPQVARSGIVASDDGKARAVVADQARFLYLTGDHEAARALADDALTRWRADTGDAVDQPTLDVAEVLADALFEDGRPEEIRRAANIADRVLRGLPSTPQPDDPDPLLTAGRLGGGRALRYRGEFVEALALDEDIWNRTRQRYGTDHPNTLRAAAKVASDLTLLGRFHEAHTLNSTVLDRLRLHGGDTVQATHRLARDLHALGRYGDARRLHHELPHQTNRDDARVLHMLRAHAATLRKAGCLTDAARLADQALDGYLRRFGHDHPATSAAKVTAALAATSAGAPGLGRSLAEEALDGFRGTLGDDHPFTGACKIDLAAVLRAVGDAQAALEQDQDAHDALARHPGIGDDHFSALCGAAGMANDLYLLGQLDAAHDVLSQARDGFVTRYGPRHPYTLACTHNLAVIGRALGTDGVQAQAEGKAARDALAGLLGEQHPEVRAAARDDLLDCDLDVPPLHDL